VAAEIVHNQQGRPGLTERFPCIVAFTLGLLHGFGFASALSEVGLPQSAIPVALLFFNVGVDIGQLLFIASVFAVVVLARQVKRRIGPHSLRGLGAFLSMPSAAFRRSGSSSAFPCLEAAAMILHRAISMSPDDRHLRERSHGAWPKQRDCCSIPAMIGEARPRESLNAQLPTAAHALIHNLLIRNRQLSVL
jgi:hypothetical protein